MGIRKNAKFLPAAEREDFVKACVLLKAEILNQGAPVADRYSRWDELTALRRAVHPDPHGIARGYRPDPLTPRPWNGTVGSSARS